MNIEKEILLKLESIERELISIGKSSEPVSMLRVWSSWFKRLSAMVIAAGVYLSRTTFGK